MSRRDPGFAELRERFEEVMHQSREALKESSRVQSELEKDWAAFRAENPQWGTRYSQKRTGMLLDLNLGLWQSSLRKKKQEYLVRPAETPPKPSAGFSSI